MSWICPSCGSYNSTLSPDYPQCHPDILPHEWKHESGISYKEWVLQGDWIEEMEWCDLYEKRHGVRP